MAEEHKAAFGKMPVLTELQKETVLEISRHINAHGFPPTIEELSGVLGIKGSSVHARIHAIIKKGYMRRIPKSPRSLEILKNPCDAETQNASNENGKGRVRHDTSKPANPTRLNE